MKVWQYHMGTWAEVDDPTLEWANMENGDDFKDLLERAGYDQYASGNLGEDWATVSAAFYCTKDGTLPCLVVVDYLDRWEAVRIDDFPSLMMWLRDYGSVCCLGTLPYYLQDEIVPAIKKGFRAWHGHDVDNCCQRCDPDEYRRQEERRRQQRAARNAK